MTVSLVVSSALGASLLLLACEEPGPVAQGAPAVAVMMGADSGTPVTQQPVVPVPRDGSVEEATDAGGEALPDASSVDDAGDIPVEDGGVDSAMPPFPSDGLGPLGTTGVQVFPEPNSDNGCSDLVLRLRFPAPPQLGVRGRIQVFDQAASAPVAFIDMAVPTSSTQAGGKTFSGKRPVFVHGNEVLVYLPMTALRPGATYSVTIDDGVFPGLALTVSDRAAWRFTVAQPASGGDLRVAYDGSGDYCTLARALDSIPTGSSDPRRVTVARGFHHGVVLVEGKQHITVSGEDRVETVFIGENNEVLNPGTAGRALFAMDRVSDITVENLTLHNVTPQGGGQAEALRLQRCDRCLVRGINAKSLQDTLLLSGRVLVEDSYIEGNVDYVWGVGAVFFRDCDIRTVGRKGYLVQARNGVGASGYVFVNCRITGDQGAKGTFLARIDASTFPGSQVAFIDCAMDDHIDPAGFQVTGFGSTSQLRFGEYGSHRLDGTALDLSRRHSAARTLTSAEADQLRNPAVVLDGFSP